MNTPPSHRCHRCRMLLRLCLCAEIPSWPTRTRVVLLMHAQEADKPTNTGRLAHLCLANSEIRYRGLRSGEPLDLGGLVDETHETWMLCLGPRSEELTPELAASAKKPVRLLVLDGNWTQASRLGAKLYRELPEARQVRLCAGGKPSEYKLRSEHHPDGMATFEAIARALGLLEGAELQAGMEGVFRKMVDRVLWSRGKLPAHEVFGGLPSR